MNWKKKIDAAEEHQRLEAESLRLERESLQLEAKKQEDQRAAEEKSLNLEKLAKEFRCHVCGVTAQRPLVRSECIGYENGPGYGVPGSPVYSDIEDWSLPGDLKKCSECSQWTCEEHIYKGICQRCAEKLPD